MQVYLYAPHRLYEHLFLTVERATTLNRNRKMKQTKKLTPLFVAVIIFSIFERT